MNTTVVICSANRPDVLAETVESVATGQKVPPREIIISVFDPKHVAERTRTHPSVRVLLNRTQGTCVQRNVAAKLVNTRYTVFLDDDVELAPNFIQSMEHLLDQNPDAIAATGLLILDGARNDKGLRREVAKRCVADYVRQDENYDHDEGQNIFVRTSIFEKILFDDNLPLYGWLEDLDFATNCLRHGRIIMNTQTCFAHLATPSGRTSGLKFGYSQIVNPFYLWRKNGRPTLRKVIFGHWLLYTAANGWRAIFRLPSERNDRSGRFGGNIIALSHVLTGKVDPSYILRLSGNTFSPRSSRRGRQVTEAGGLR